jgi:molybdate transport system substrate-binding protein
MAVAVLPACESDETSTTEPLLVLAASDLQRALPEAVDSFSVETAIEVSVTYGSTGSFATQIGQGAPADIFLSANEQVAQELAAGGYTAGDLQLYALGRLALIWAPSTPQPSGLEGVRDPLIHSIAIANPEHAPYGAAAMSALDRSGILDDVRDRLVPTENVAQVLRVVRTGNADVGIVALGLVQGQDEPYILLTEDLHPPLRQVGAVLKSSARPAEARRFLEFLAGPTGSRILQLYGFGRP